MGFLRSTILCKKRIVPSLAIMLAMFGVLGFSNATALAETSDFRSALELKSSIGNTPVLRDDDELIVGCAGEITNGSGELQCVMPFGNYLTRIQAATGYNNGITGSVECFVKFPNGTIQELGVIPASNGATLEVEFLFCPYGTYKFIYLANVSDTLDVAGFIYD